jgi:hypothetical protein
MPRKITAPSRPRALKHEPDCPGDHIDDLTCEEFDRLHDEHRQGASWDCPSSPSRTQPSHSFNFDEYGPDDETECAYGCGMTWDRLRGVE